MDGHARSDSFGFSVNSVKVFWPFESGNLDHMLSVDSQNRMHRLAICL